MEPLALSIEDAARRPGVGRTFMIALLNRGEIRSLKVGRRRLVPMRALNDFLERASDAEDQFPLRPVA